MDKYPNGHRKTYPDILLERFLKTSVCLTDRAYRIKRCVKVTAIPVSDSKTITIPAALSFIIEKKDSFASLEIRRKRVGPQLMLLRMKLIEVLPRRRDGCSEE